MKNKRNLRDMKLMFGVSLLCLALLWVGVIFSSHKQQTDLQNEFIAAVDKGNSARARELLSKGVDPKKMANPTLGLISAVIYCDPATVQAFINKGVNVNGRIEHGVTPLRYAIIHRRYDMVKVLLQNGADVWTKTDDGDTALAAMSKPAHRFARHDNDPGIIDLLKQAEGKSRKGRKVS